MRDFFEFSFIFFGFFFFQILLDSKTQQNIILGNSLKGEIYNHKGFKIYFKKKIRNL